jgi:hypothetical protein
MLYYTVNLSPRFIALGAFAAIKYVEIILTPKSSEGRRKGLIARDILPQNSSLFIRNALEFQAFTAATKGGDSAALANCRNLIRSDPLMRSHEVCSAK